MSFATTVRFKKIYPDYDTFLNDFESSPIEYDPIILPIVYKSIYNEYCNSNIAYDDIDSFKRRFYNSFVSLYGKYILQFNLTKTITKFTDDDYTVINEMISATGNNDLSIVDQPLDKLIDTINSQIGSKSKQNKYISYIQAIDNMKTNGLVELNDEFRNHFMKIFVESEFIY